MFNEALQQIDSPLAIKRYANNLRIHRESHKPRLR